MRNTMFQLILVVIGVTSVHAVKLLQTSSFHAHVSPAFAPERVLAIQGRDTIKMMGSEGDYYFSTANPGRWKIFVDAKKPYRNADLEVNDIKPGTEMDLGEITLQKSTD